MEMMNLISCGDLDTGRAFPDWCRIDATGASPGYVASGAMLLLQGAPGLNAEATIDSLA